MARDFKQIDIFGTTGKATTGAGNTIDVRSFRNAGVTITTTGSANMTIKCQGSCDDARPDFSSAASSTNKWSYIQIVNADDGAAVNGSTGIVLSGTDVMRTYWINTDNISWFTLNITARSAGTIFATGNITDNQ